MAKVGELFVTIGGSWGSLSGALDGAVGKIDAFEKQWGRAAEVFRQSGEILDRAGEFINRGLGAAVEKAATFEHAMSGVDAVSDATGQEMEQLSALALQMGADTVFGATDAARGIEELAKASVSTKDIMEGGLAGALALAAAGEISVGEAAETAATAMSVFGLKGEDVMHVADLLAAAASASLSDVGDLRLAFQQSAAVADNFGLSIEQTTGILAMFSQHALKGSDGGTSFKQMLLHLLPTSGVAAKKMEELGLSFFDANGQFVGITNVAEQLKTKLGGLSDEQRNLALRTIFGSDAVRAALELYKAGAAGVEEWTDKVNQAGAAQQMATVRMDNLKGAQEQLNGALESAQIAIGNELIPAYRSLTEWTTAAVERFNELSPAAKETVAVLATMAGTTLEASGELMIFISRIPDFITGMAKMKIAIETMGVSLTKLSGPIGLVLTLLQHLDDFSEENIRKAMDRMNGIDLKTGELKATMEATIPVAEKLWTSFIDFATPVAAAIGGAKAVQDTLTQSFEGSQAAADALHAELTTGVAETTRAVDAFRGAQGTAMTDAIMRVQEYSEVWAEIPEETQTSFTALIDGLEEVQFHLTVVEDQTKRASQGFEEMGRSLSGFQTSMQHFQGFKGMSGPIIGIGGMGSFPGMAAGGTVSRGGAAMIGEAGPEIMDFPAGARVRPLGAGGGGGARVVNRNTYITVQGSVVHERDIWRLARDGGIKHGRSNLGKNLA